MQFQVPKFIDVEDKIFGPLTFKQFIYLGGGAGACVLAFWIIPYTILVLPVVALIAAFSLALAFWNFNGKPFIDTVQAAFTYLVNTRTYVWKRREHADKDRDQIQKELEQIEESIIDNSDDTITRESLRGKSAQDLWNKKQTRIERQHGIH